MMRAVACTACLVLLLSAAAGAERAAADGAGLFRQKCAPCHGTDAKSGASGDIRGVSLATVRYAVGGGGQMPEIDLTDAEVAAIAAWLAAVAE